MLLWLLVWDELSFGYCSSREVYKVNRRWHYKSSPVTGTTFGDVELFPAAALLTSPMSRASLERAAA